MRLYATSGLFFFNSSFVLTPFRPLLHGNQIEGASWAMFIGMEPKTYLHQHSLEC